MAFKVDRDGNYFSHTFTVSDEDINIAAGILRDYEKHFWPPEHEFHTITFTPEAYNGRGAQVVEAMCSLLQNHVDNSHGRFTSSDYSMHKETTGEHFHNELDSPYMITANFELLDSVKSALDRSRSVPVFSALKPVSDYKEPSFRNH